VTGSAAGLYALSASVAFILAVLASPAVAALAKRFGLLDIPGGRRQHPRPIPRPGGVAIAFAFGGAIFLLWLVDLIAGGPLVIPEEVRSPRFTLTMFAAVLGATIGLLDDLLDLRARWQFLGYLVVAAIIIAAGIRVEYVTDPLNEDEVVRLGELVAIGFTAFWVVGMNVALNFIDGLDGLAAGVAVIAALTLGGLALLPHINEPFVAWMEFTLAGALAGFLLFNFHPARLFLGTSGVAFVGTMLAVLSIFGTAKVAALLLVLGVPIVDAFYVMVRRVAQGRAPFAPDRGHLHHRLLDIGLTHTQAVLLIYAMTAALALMAVLTSGRAQVASFAGFTVALGVAVLAMAQRSAKAEALDPALYPEDADSA
jgi:UDP-GlcNAc:undecaprenyl-phosphate GlcNAc-1-phosphate transferase